MNNEFERKVLSGVDKALIELKYTNIKRTVLKEGVVPDELIQKELTEFSFPKVYSYTCDKKEFCLQFFKSNSSCRAVFSTKYDGYGYNLQFNEGYKYCGTDTKISKEIIEDVKLGNGCLLDITKRILKWILL